MTLSSWMATMGLLVGPQLSGRSPPRWRAPPEVTRACVQMGISDRTATEGALYEGWGAEGMRVLNKTSNFQKTTDTLEISHYDAVLIVAARAKQNAYEHAEEISTGYIGSSFGGSNIGSGMRKKKPAKSEVVSAIEELLTEYDETGELPELVTPGIPQDVLDQWAAEEAAEEAALLKAAKANATAARAAAKASLSPEAAAAAAKQAADKLGLEDEVHEEEAEEEAEEEEEDEEEEDEDLLASLLGDEEDFEDDVALEEDSFDEEEEAAAPPAASESAAAADESLAEDELADLFGSVQVSGDGAIEASGMSPGDAG